MKNMEKASRLLVANGYDEELATQLPKLFISDYFNNQEEKISEALDLFIDHVQSGRITSDQNHNVRFASIIKMEESDMNPKAVDGLFYNFKSHLREEFFHKVKRLPLRRILENGGAFSNDDGYLHYFVPVVEDPQEYSDLCEVILYVGNVERVYIKMGDLYSLLKNKGFDEEMISSGWEEYGFGPSDSISIPNEGIYIKYDAVMNLGDFENISIQKKKVM